MTAADTPQQGLPEPEGMEFRTEVLSPEDMVMVSTQGLTCVLTSECVRISIGGVDRYVSLQDFSASLGAAVLDTVESGNMDNGVALPRGTYAFAQSSGGCSIGMYFPGGVVDVRYQYHEDGAARPMVVPNVVVAIRMSRQGGQMKVESSRYFCTDLSVGELGGRIPKNHAGVDVSAGRMYLFPFTNMYDSANMCFGNNAMQVVYPADDLRGLSWYYDMVWASPFNNDLGVKAVARSISPEAWYDQLAKAAEDGEAFPYEVLRGYVPR